MPDLRFNHMELTLPKGSLDEGGVREDIRRFYSEVFGFKTDDPYILKQKALLLSTDSEGSQFILVTQQTKHMHSPGYDHLGFMYETRTEVDDVLAKCQKYQEHDDRVELVVYDDMDTRAGKVHTFYVKYLLPIWFDIQCFEFKPEKAPEKRWVYA